uniref:Uncharacterized protein n=1 Tax=Rhizophora mucronata TaxID=61149 RepID=A0A2P2J3X9_RHIMU
MKSKELFDPGNSGRWQTATNHWKSCLSPIEEAEGHCEQVTNSSSDAEDCWHTTELATESPTTSYFCKDFTYLGTSWKQNCRQVKELNEDNLSSGTSPSGSEKSSEIGVEEEYDCPEFDGCDLTKEADNQESSSTSTEDLAAFVVEDSQETSSLHNDG